MDFGTVFISYMSALLNANLILATFHLYCWT